MMASSYSALPQEEEHTFEDHTEDWTYVGPPPFDASILTPEQRVELYELKRKNPWTIKGSLARTIRVNLIRDRAELEGRDVTQYEFDVAYALREVMYWVPPTQLEGIYNSTLELEFEDICLPCVEDIASDLDSLVLINKCLDLICETRKLDEPLLELADLGDELEVDKLFLEIENPLVKNFHENENIVFYLIDGDRVDYFVKTSFEHVVEFVFPPYAFDSRDHLNLKEHFIIHVTYLVKLFEEKSVYFLWTVVCSFAHFDSCSCRRRTKGALAQPFDTYDQQAHKVKLET
ncbi:hypothetical protein F2Q70_00003030 [Brassica cretica]|uniref:Uncharacterized protein n=1 Tax=Brassica cretica TaxID=69181 RepID=A0A8S9J013_BRACR|nr:hypothetical protein F2Q70_00003030 [Brassica cretica]